MNISLYILELILKGIIGPREVAECGIGENYPRKLRGINRVIFEIALCAQDTGFLWGGSRLEIRSRADLSHLVNPSSRRSFFLPKKLIRFRGSGIEDGL